MPDYVLYHVKPEERAQIKRAIVEADNAADFEYRGPISDISGEMSSVEELTILSISDLRVWVEILERLLSWFEISFEGRKGWVLPMLRIIESKTGEFLDSSNFEEKCALLLERSDDEDGYGFGPDISNLESEQRMKRRELEQVQRRESSM